MEITKKVLTVSCMGRDYQYETKFVPFIKLAGVWLEKAGFKTGDKVEVNIAKNELRISKLKKQ